VSGHSKWSSIKHKKGAADSKRGQLFSKLSRAIIVAAKEGGPDPAGNLALQNAIEKARSYSMPKDNIERAIAKGSGADADAASFETVVYEGYGPEGVAVLVEAVTDNRNRTASEVRHAFTRHGGNLGTTGAVAWQFERRGVVVVAAAEAGADDIELDGSSFVVTSAPEALAGVRQALADAGYDVESVELAMVPKSTVAVADERAARRIMNLVEGLEDTEDVQDVYANFDIPETVLESVAS
jgi:YebC/PmpR family DNA-binding regulatory protein